MKKLSVVFAVLACSCMHAMQNKEDLTAKTMLAAIKKEERELLINHQKNFVPLKKYTLVALLKSKNASIRDTFFKYPITLSHELMNEFVDDLINNKENLGFSEKQKWTDFIHQLIGATGIIPTVGGFNELSFYKNKFVQWYLNEIHTDALEQHEIKQLQQNLVIELEGYSKDVEKGEKNAYEYFFLCGFERIRALIENDTTVQDEYEKKFNKKLTFDVVKAFRPSGPLIMSLLMAIATGNMNVIHDICRSQNFLMREMNVKPLYYDLMKYCYKKNETQQISTIIQNGQNNPVQGVNSQQTLPNRLHIMNRLQVLVEEMKYGAFLDKKMPLLYTVLKVAFLYYRLDAAKLIIDYVDILDEQTFATIKEVVCDVLKIKKYVTEQGQILFKENRTSEEYKINQNHRVELSVMNKLFKQFVYTHRRFAEIFEKVKKRNNLKICILPLLDESKEKIIVPFEVGLEIIKYCPLVYKKIEINEIIKKSL